MLSVQFKRLADHVIVSEQPPRNAARKHQSVRFVERPRKISCKRFHGEQMEEVWISPTELLRDLDISVTKDDERLREPCRDFDFRKIQLQSGCNVRRRYA